MDRKRTAWKKSRKFGDVHGGRKYKKIADKVFNRVHSLQAPTADQERPVVKLDNPSRDFFFPLSPEETLAAMKALDPSQVEGITHLWFRRFKKTEYERGELPLACFMCGSGVRAIVLYPWPKTMELNVGRKKPKPAILKMYSPYSNELVQHSGYWYLKFTLESLKNLYIELLLYHEIGHHIDWYTRRWTKANLRECESFADQYAYERTSFRTITLNQDDS